MLVGIVGKPSCGKSTFFKAATLADAAIANYPFTTIKPNHAVGFVKVKDPARDFGKVSNPRIGYVMGEWRFVSVDLIDVAGLVPGAHEGQGMGSQFLSDLNQADCLIHVIDVSGSVNEKGEEVPTGSYDPVNDVKFLEEELDWWYFDILGKGWEKFMRHVQMEHKSLALSIESQLSGLRVNEEMVKKAIAKLRLDPTQPISWTKDDLYKLSRELRILSKPMMIAANKADKPGAWQNFERLKAAFPDYKMVACSAELELALREAAKHGVVEYIPGGATFSLKNEAALSEKQRSALGLMQQYMAAHGGTGVQEVMNFAVFNLLKYKAIFPGGVSKLEDSEGRVIPDCFLMPGTATALDFAFRLHTDFGKNFVKAINVRTKLPIGKDTPLADGDIVEIMAKK